MSAAWSSSWSWFAEDSDKFLAPGWGLLPSCSTGNAHGHCVLVSLCYLVQQQDFFFKSLILRSGKTHHTFCDGAVIETCWILLSLGGDFRCMANTRVVCVAGSGSRGAFRSLLGLCAAQPRPPAHGLVWPPSTSSGGRHGSGSAAPSGRSRGGVRRGDCGASAGSAAAVFALVTPPRFLQPTQAPAGAGVLHCKFSSYL